MRRYVKRLGIGLMMGIAIPAIAGIVNLDTEKDIQNRLSEI